MAEELLVRADDEAREVAVYFGSGPIYVLAEGGVLTERFTDPIGVEPMVPLDEAVNDVLALIEDVEIPVRTRKALAEKLGVEPEHVGKAPVRRAKASAA